MVTRFLALVVCLAFALSGATACKKKDAEKIPPDARKVCERAADRYEKCLGQEMGKELQRIAASMRNVGACAGDADTVKAYKICLPKSDCKKFLDCVTKIASGEMPK